MRTVTVQFRYRQNGSSSWAGSSLTFSTYDTDRESVKEHILATHPQWEEVLITNITVR